jgi:hypothetical protein
MTLRNRLLLLGITLLTLFGTQAGAQENVFDCNRSKEFGRYLFFTHQYELARHELERVNFFCEFDSSSNLMLLQTFRKLRLFDNENAFFNLMRVNETLYSARLDYRDEFIRSLMAQGRYRDVIEHIDAGFDFNQKAENHLGALLLQQKWTEASSFASKQETTGSISYNLLKDVAGKSVQTKRKKPWVAAAMSVLLPGSGKAYCTYWGDAAISFSFIASSTFMTYRAFNKYGSHSVYPWIAGGIAASYYLANIYGAHQSATRYNNNLNHTYVHETERILFSDY